MSALRVALAQFDFAVGAIAENAARVIELADAARDRLGARVLVCPELTISGYLAEDLFLRPSFVARCEAVVAELATRVHGIDLLVGHPLAEGGQLYNAMSWIRDGQVLARYRKQALPNYTVFDEKRYFDPGHQPIVVDVDGLRIAPLICEDIWEEGPARAAARAGAQALLVMNASPFDVRNRAERYAVLKRRAREHGLPIAYVNMVAGQDDLVFDGGSCAIDADGAMLGPAPAFADGLFALDLDPAKGEWQAVDWSPARETDIEIIYRGLVRATRDYVEKNRFPSVLLGLSGGVDSALTLAIAVDALGAERVTAVMMPSRYTASLSVEQAQAQALALGVNYRVISIEPPYAALVEALAPHFAGRDADITEENLQSRIRGVLLMAMSNKFGGLLLSTGNKSEVAVGYATIYGDMCGGFAPLKDCYKTTVYELCRYRNSLGAAIPAAVIERAPSAELRANQTDQDSLPPYSLLDEILRLYVEDDLSAQDIVARGLDVDTVHRVIALVLRNEFKRRQAAPGPRVTRRAFDRDRRYPITSGWRETR